MADRESHSDQWTTSQAIPAPDGQPGLAKNATASIDDIEKLLGANDKPRPIGAGVLVFKPKASVTVKSLTVEGKTTNFFKNLQVAQNPGDGKSTFVAGSGIRKNADTYPGWHEEATTTAADYGSFHTTVDDSGKAEGLKVTGKSQLIYGFDADKRPTNVDLTELVKNYVVDGSAVEDSNRDGFYAQIPIFFYPGKSGAEQFTTLRAPIPASGKLSEAATWTTSRAVGSIGKGGQGTLTQFAHELGDFEVLGFGFTVDPGQVVVKSASFNGYDFSFVAPKDEPTKPDPKPTTPAKPATTSASVKFTKSTVAYNAAETATNTVKATGTKKVPSGMVALKFNGKTYYRDLSSKGAASVKFKAAIAVGTHRADVSYKTDDKQVFKNYSKTGAASLRVTKAKPKASVKLSAKTVKASKKAKATIKVTVPGSLSGKASKVKVAVYDGKKKIKSAKTNSSGKVTVTLPKLKKGNHSITVKTTATKNLKSAKSKAVKLKVKK